MVEYASNGQDLDAGDDEDLQEVQQLLSSLGEETARRRRRQAQRAPTPVGRGSNLYRQPAGREVVSQQQLQGSLERVQKNFEATAVGVKKLDGDLASISETVNRNTHAIAALKRENDRLREMILFTTLLGGSKKLRATAPLQLGNTSFKEGDVFPLEESEDRFDKLLPMMMLGGGGANGSSAGGMFDNPMMMFLMIEALGGK